MTMTRRALRLGAFVLVASTLSGCVVLPLPGWGHRGHHHYDGASDGRGAPADRRGDHPRRRGW